MIWSWIKINKRQCLLPRHQINRDREWRRISKRQQLAILESEMLQTKTLMKTHVWNRIWHTFEKLIANLNCTNKMKSIRIWIWKLHIKHNSSNRTMLLQQATSTTIVNSKMSAHLNNKTTTAGLLVRSRVSSTCQKMITLEILEQE